MMQALLMNLALFCQANGGFPAPPAPIANGPVLINPAAKVPAVPGAEVPGAETTEEMRNWLLARLVVDLGFDPQKSAEVKSLLATMDDSQMKFLVAYYKERAAKRDLPATAKPSPESEQTQALEQAQLNQQVAEAYGDHLKREYDRQLLQGFMTQNLVYQNIVNNQRMMYMNTPYTYVAGYGYGPFGYGAMSPMAYGYGAPGFGTSMMYGNPYGGYGMGFY